MEEAIKKQIDEVIKSYSNKNNNNGKNERNDKTRQSYDSKTGKVTVIEAHTDQTEEETLNEQEGDDDEEDCEENLNVIADQYTEDGFSFLMISDFLLTIKNDSWLIDSGTTGHITSNFSALHDPQPTNHSIKATHVSNLHIQQTTGKKDEIMIIEDVF